ncbi:MAG: YceI family protein [Bacteriovoracaceae bacterium]|jgi:hypothetical protein|nr:YceI family protein [Bacteriovoracaceae bacterium]
MNLKIVLLFVTILVAQVGWAKTCPYSVDFKGAEVHWTAFKTTEKAPVSGVFKKFEIFAKDKNLKANSIKEILKNHSIDVDTRSVFSKNKARDIKIAKFFFGNMTSPTVKAKIKNPKGTTFGVAVLELYFNDVRGNIPVDYELKDGYLTFNGSFDMLDFALEKSHAEISKACSVKHKKKTWTDAEFKFRIPVKKSC